MSAAPTASEFQEQAAVIQWWGSYCRTVGLDERLLLAIPNGAVLAGDAKQRAIQMAKLKRSGLRVGAPDLLLAVARPLFIEMKRRGGKASDAQCVMASVLTGQGHETVICDGSGRAIDAIKAHLSQSASARAAATR